MPFILGYSQAVRHGTFIESSKSKTHSCGKWASTTLSDQTPAFDGSNPSIPARGQVAPE